MTLCVSFFLSNVFGLMMMSPLHDSVNHHVNPWCCCAWILWGRLPRCGAPFLLRWEAGQWRVHRKTARQTCQGHHQRPFQVLAARSQNAPTPVVHLQPPIVTLPGDSLDCFGDCSDTCRLPPTNRYKQTRQGIRIEQAGRIRRDIHTCRHTRCRAASNSQ